MCAPEGYSEFCFPKIESQCSRDEVEGNIETRRKNKTHYFSRKHTLSALLYSKERKINNTYTIIVFHDIMTINRKFYSVKRHLQVQNSQNVLE